MTDLSATLLGHLRTWVGAGAPQGAKTAIDFVLEVTPVRLSDSTPVTLYSSAYGYDKVTGNKESLPRLVLPRGIGISVLSDDIGTLLEDGSFDFRQFVIGEMTFGGFEIGAVDDVMDAWATGYGWGDAAGKLKVGRKQDAYTAFETFFTFLVRRDPHYDLRRLRFEIRSPGANINAPGFTAAFTGGGTWEGGADHKGKVKPWVLGRKRMVPAVLVDFAELRYVASGGGDGIQAVDEGYEQGHRIGSTLTAQLANGGFTLANAPQGAIHADIQGEKFDGGAYSAQQGKVIEELLTKEAGGALNTTDRNAATLTIGVHQPYDSQAPLRELLDFARQPLFLLYPKQDGTEYRLLEIQDPDSATIDETYDLANGEIIDYEAESLSPPVWKVRCCFQHLGDVLSEIKAEEASEQARLSTSCQFETAEDATVLTDHPNAITLTAHTALYNSADAATKDGSILTLFKVPRKRHKVTMGSKLLHSWVGDYVTIKDSRSVQSRYNLSGAGINCLVTGLSVDLGPPPRVVMECWG